ncbi:SIMPL domain-containing protein [Dendrosporobacter sp. 1207_IL3150]|uniref:SIMPL domain-containing protein n=1 Tax=Dendrosporobacter sp. 1207_IL3150 TaxID=3084054 RepID=UPI002FDAFFF7
MFKKILLLVAVSLMLITPAFASEATKTVVQVSGSSQKEIAPDIARISIAINTFNSNIENAKIENNRTVNKVLASLKEQGVSEEKIKTDTYQVNPIYSYEDDRLPKLKGYRITERLEVVTAIDKASIVVNEVTKAGAVEINWVRFESENESESRKDALKDAIQDALNKADIIASALNKKVAGVTLVNESGVYYNPVIMESRMLKSANMDAAAPPNILVGKVTVGANVQVTVQLK